MKGQNFKIVSWNQIFLKTCWYSKKRFSLLFCLQNDEKFTAFANILFSISGQCAKKRGSLQNMKMTYAEFQACVWSQLAPQGLIFCKSSLLHRWVWFFEFLKCGPVRVCTFYPVRPWYFAQLKHHHLFATLGQIFLKLKNT